MEVDQIIVEQNYQCRNAGKAFSGQLYKGASLSQDVCHLKFFNKNPGLKEEKSKMIKVEEEAPAILTHLQ